MSWIKDGEVIDAVYCGVPVRGVVQSSRVKYGGRVQYTVELETPVQLKWRSEPTSIVLVDDQDLCEFASL